MPSLLCKDSIRQLEGAVDCLGLAIVGLGIPSFQQTRIPNSEYTAEIGLIGAAAELSVSACYLQASGRRAIFRADGSYRTAAHIIDDFSALLRSPTPQLGFLTQGVNRPEQHRATLLTRCGRFQLLTKLRAGGLHAAQAPSREVCVSLANEVCLFLEQLRQSERLRPYLVNIPKTFELVTESAVLIDDLVSKLKTARSMEEQAESLLNLFLILPEIPEKSPEWLQAFERVAVVLRQKDLALLLKTLEQAIPVSLRKNKAGGSPIPVVYDSKNPDALPIAPQYLRTEFTRRPERFYADVANANGRLNEGMLHVPPEAFVKELFAIGLEEAEVVQAGEDFDAHRVWPFIAASLAVSGTPGPMWFLVCRCDDLGQLKALLTRASKIKAGLKKNLDKVMPGIEAIRHGKKWRRRNYSDSTELRGGAHPRWSIAP
jgi:hypothetical protein